MSALWSVLMLALAPAVVLAQPPKPDDDPLARHLFPPELLMKHGDAIGLEPDQREAIKAAIQEAQASFIDLQWDMQSASGKMEELLQSRHVDEAAVLAQLDRVLDLERHIKKTQFSLLIRIKNALSPSQQDRLEALR